MDESTRSIVEGEEMSTAGVQKLPIDQASVATEYALFRSSVVAFEPPNPVQLVFGDGGLLSGNSIIHLEPLGNTMPSISTVSFIDYEYASPCPATFDVAKLFCRVGWSFVRVLAFNDALPSRNTVASFSRHAPLGLTLVNDHEVNARLGPAASVERLKIMALSSKGNF